MTTMRTWTFFGHWNDDRIVIDHVEPGEVEDQRQDPGTGEGLWAASGTGPDQAAAHAAAIADYDTRDVFHIDGRTLVVVPTRHEYHGGEAFAVYEITEEGPELLTVADPWPDMPTEPALRAFLSPRRQALVRLMAEYRITAGADYEYQDVSDLLYGTDPVERFVAIHGDETYHQILVTDLLQEALDHLAAIVGEEYGGLPVGIFDLDTTTIHRVEATMRLIDPITAPNTAPQQPDTHRETARITWSEIVSYRQAIDIDVPDGFTGDLADLIDPDDLPDAIDGIPTGFRTGWLDRMDPADIADVCDRTIHSVVEVNQDRRPPGNPPREQARTRDHDDDGTAPRVPPG